MAVSVCSLWSCGKYDTSVSSSVHLSPLKVHLDYRDISPINVCRPRLCLQPAFYYGDGSEMLISHILNPFFVCLQVTFFLCLPLPTFYFRAIAINPPGLPCKQLLRITDFPPNYFIALSIYDRCLLFLFKVLSVDVIAIRANPFGCILFTTNCTSKTLPSLSMFSPGRQNKFCSLCKQLFALLCNMPHFDSRCWTVG